MVGVADRPELSDEKECLELLEIEGHGNPWALRLSSKDRAYNTSTTLKATVLTAANVDFVATMLANSLPWCCSCVIILSGCHTGNLRGFKSWQRRLAEITGCNVRAPLAYLAGTATGGNSTLDMYYDWGAWWDGRMGYPRNAETYRSQKDWVEFNPDDTEEDSRIHRDPTYVPRL
jgi:hypothetical protein